MRRVVTAALVLAAAGCGVTDPDDVEQRPRALVERALEQWQAEGPSSYEYEITYICSSCEPGEGPFDVTVEADAVVSAVHSGSDTQVTGPARDAIRTIDGLFEQILGFMEDDPSSAAVQFDSELGYPTQVFIAVDGNDAAQDWGFRIEAFEGPGES